MGTSTPSEEEDRVRAEKGLERITGPHGPRWRRACRLPSLASTSTNAAPNRTADYAVFPINAATGNSRASVVGTFSTTVGSGPGPSKFLDTPPAGGGFLNLTPALLTNTGTSFQVFAAPSVANATAEAANLAAAINRNLSATNAAIIVTIAATNTVTVYTLTTGTRVTLAVGINSVSSLTFGAVTARGERHSGQHRGIQSAL